ncbi:MAG: lysophospholipid acyltransferase family protein [Betaproteobacteria bacterium]
MISIIRCVLFEVLRITLTVIFATIAPLTAPLSARGRYRIITTWSKLVTITARLIVGIRYEVDGLENLPKTPCVIMSKHQSAWETVAFQVLLPPQVWVLKKSLLWIPFFGWGLAMMNPIAIDRRNGPRALKKMLEQGKSRVRDGWYIVIFPEGTRVAPDETGDYQIGGAWLARKLNVPIVPIAHNAGKVWPKNAFLKKPGMISVVVGPPIPTTSKDPNQLIDEVKDWIEATTKSL